MPRPLHMRRNTICASLIAAVIFLGACNSGGGSSGSATDPSGDFAMDVGAVGELIEGSSDALFIPVNIERSNGYSGSVTLRVEGQTRDDVAELTARYPNEAFTPDNDSGGVLLNLAIADLALMPHTRSLVLIASDGVDEHRYPIEVSVEPVNAPDVYLLIGQSNMVGSSGEGTREAYPGGPDESNVRVKQLNVTYNDMFGTFATADAYTDPSANIREPAITVAEDPLHVPRGEFADDGAAKSDSYIGLGLTFGKQALNDTTREVVLVPAAWSGSAFCANDDGPTGQWNAGPTTNPALGNTLLYDRAITRVDNALAETGGILRGILWHQGESDANEICAPLYRDNLVRLIESMRSDIAVDARGAAARGPDVNIPFVVGTLSVGGDVAEYTAPKLQIDQTLRDMPNQARHVGLSLHDDLVPPAYPCGNGGCIHFGPEAYREMGRRYYAALRDAAFEQSDGDLSVSDGS